MSVLIWLLWTKSFMGPKKLFFLSKSKFCKELLSTPKYFASANGIPPKPLFQLLKLFFFLFFFLNWQQDSDIFSNQIQNPILRYSLPDDIWCWNILMGGKIFSHRKERKPSLCHSHTITAVLLQLSTHRPKSDASKFA